METKIVNYKIISEIGSEALAQKVREALFQGWEPIGGIAVDGASSGRHVIHYQAVVKREDLN